MNFLLVMAARSANERIQTWQQRGSTSVANTGWESCNYKARFSYEAGGAVEIRGPDRGRVDVTILQCRFNVVSCTTNGGAVCTWTVVALIDGCSFHRCKTSGLAPNIGDGGAIYSLGSSLCVNATTFTHCWANANGGAIYAASYWPSISDHLFDNDLNVSSCKFEDWKYSGERLGASEQGAFIYAKASKTDPLSRGMSVHITGDSTIQDSKHLRGKSHFYLMCNSIAISDLKTNVIEDRDHRGEGAVLVLNGRTEVLLEDCVFSAKHNYRDPRRYGFTETERWDSDIGACVTYRNCLFTSMICESTGAIKAAKCNLTITSCNFTEITEVKDGIIYIQDDRYACQDAVIEDCIIKQCTTTGGSLLLITPKYENLSRISILTTTFDSNTCAEGCVKWRLQVGLTYGTSANFVIENCTFKNHKRHGDCLITIDTAAHFPSPVTLKQIVVVDTDLVCTNGVISIATSALTFDECVFDTTSVSMPSNQDIDKGIVVLAGGAGTKFLLRSCKFVDCEVIGSGSVIMSTVDQSGALATELIIVENCDVSGCKTNESHQLSFICNQLLITGGTFECNDTHRSSFIGIWITGAPEKELESYVSATFIMDGPNSAFQHSMIELHSDAGHDTYFDSLSVTSSSEPESNTSVPLAEAPPYILLENDGDVFFFNATFDVPNEKAIHQAEGRTGKVAFLTEKPSKPVVPPVVPPVDGTDESLTDLQDSSPDSNADLIGGIIGGILAVVAIAGIVVLVLFILRRRQSKNLNSASGSCDNTQETNTGTQTTVSGDPADDPLGEWEKPVDFPEIFNEDENDA